MHAAEETDRPTCRSRDYEALFLAAATNMASFLPSRVPGRCPSADLFLTMIIGGRVTSNREETLDLSLRVRAGRDLVG